MNCFFDFDKKKPGFQNSNLSAPRKKLQEKYFSFQLFFSSFLDLDNTNFDFCEKIFGKVVKTTFYVSKEHFQSKNFEKNVVKFNFRINIEAFGTPARTFLRSWQNWKLMSKRTI